MSKSRKRIKLYVGIRLEEKAAESFKNRAKEEGITQTELILKLLESKR